MNHEQCEAWLMERIDKAFLVAGTNNYVMDRDCLLLLIEHAWSAGRNYGFRDGGEHAIETFDATLGKAKP